MSEPAAPLQLEPDPAASAMAAVAQAVSGPGTPDAASVTSRPEGWNVAALVLAGPAISGVLVFVIYIIGFRDWPVAVADARVHGLTWIGMSLALMLGLVVFRLASGALKRVEAKAGPGSLVVEAGA